MPKRLRVSWKWIVGAIAIGAAIVVCIHENVFLPKPVIVQQPVQSVIGEAYPSKPPLVAQTEPPVEPPPPVVEEVKPPEPQHLPPSVIETPAPQPPPVVKEPEPALPPVIKASEPKPPPIVKPKKTAPPPVVEKPAPPAVEEPNPLPPVVEAPAPEPQPSPPAVVEAPLPPLPPVEKPVRRQAKLPPTYFVNREVISDDIDMFPRWTGMISRFRDEASMLDSICGEPLHTPCKLKEWKNFLENLRGAPLLEKLRQVNSYLNKYPYIDDIVNWGFDNYWETPYEFQRKSGNCKDYAIAKFMSLRAIGVPNDIMRLMVLKDLNLGGVIHAILVVSTDENSYILDNQIKQVMTTDRVYHYVPIYSINEEHWWQHFVLN